MGNLNATFTYTQYTGTNTIKIAIYKDSDPSTEVAAQYKQGAFTNGIFYFAGLDNVAYKVKRFEVDNADHTHILADYGVFYVFTPSNQKIEYKAPVKWYAGTTLMADGVTVFPAGVSSFTNADWAGWDAQMLHYFGGIYERGTDYSYDSVAGIVAKLLPGDVFEQDARYELIFAPRISDAGSDTGTSFGFAGKKYITANSSLTAADMGKKILIKGAAGYLEVALPKLSDVQELKPFYIEMPPSNTVRCAKFKAQPNEKIDFAKGNLTELCLYPSESFEIYKETDDTDTANVVSYWRIQNAQGNFLKVGETVSDEGDTSHVINKIQKDGGGFGLDANVYARLYNYILNLPSAQVVTYAQWGSGNNKYKFSLKDSITNLFHIPDTRGLYESQSNAARLANSYEDSALEDHEHLIPIGSLSENGTAPFGNSGITQNGGQYYGKGSHKWDLTSKPYILASPGGWVQQDSSSSTHPENVANNKYLRY
jgi:hypothetical protein